MLSQAVHVIVALGFGWLVLTAYRWIRYRSAAIGIVVGIAILVRVTMGLALFWISYLQLPVAESLQRGGGFWRFALDATGYYQMAASGVDGHTFMQGSEIASPVFVNALALWMFAVGLSPAAAMFLNLCLYLALVVMLVWCFRPVNEWRRDLPCVAGVAAYSFSPIILLHSTQPLKDELSNVCVAVALFGVLWLHRLFCGSSSGVTKSEVLAGTLALTVAIWGITGIRWYYGLIVWLALALSLAVLAVSRRRTPLRRYVISSIAILIVTWAGFWATSGPYYHIVVGANLDRIAEQLLGTSPAEGTSTTAGTILRRLAGIPSDLFNMARLSRTGFLLSGGATNVVVALGHDSEAGMAQAEQAVVAQKRSAAYERTDIGLPDIPTPESYPAVDEDAVAEQNRAARAIPVSVWDHVVACISGLAIIFVAPSVLDAMTPIEIPAAGGTRWLANVDTLFLDVSLLVVLGLLWTSRRAIGDRLPVVIFSVILACMTAVLVGYVVTNFGTLLRMRSLVAVPLWLMVIAVGRRAGTRAEASAAGEPVPATAT